MMKGTGRFLRFASVRPPGARRGGRLVRDYYLVSVLLVSGGLITSGLLEIYFRYFENQEQVALFQQEVAAGAAFKIEQFVQEIERTMRGAAKSRQIVLRGISPEYKFELRKLLLIAPPITEAAATDEAGMIRARVSRLRTVLSGGKRDLSASAAFKRAREGKSYFGPVTFVRGSEPYMTIAVPIERFAGEVVGVLRAEVNLKYIWEVISGIRVGKAGYAYVVTRAGDLVAHPDISLVLQRRSLARLPQVRAAFSRTGLAEDGPRGVIGENFQGGNVFSSHARVAGLDWAVIIEQPVAEAYEKLYASLFRTSALLLVGLGTALLASLFVARRVVRPLGALREGVERIGGGEMDFRLELKTGDEIEVLAEEFNKMTAALGEAYAGLEQKVEERTRKLTEALEQQTATSEVLSVISGSPTDLQPVYQTILENITRLCESNIAALFLYDGEFLICAASQGTTPEFAQLLKEWHRRPGRETPTRLAALERRTVHVADVLSDSSFSPRPLELYQRENVRTALSVPMLRESSLVGVITTWRREVRPFTDKQIELVTTFATQAAIAVENVRLFQEIQEKNRQLEEALEQQTATSEILGVISSSPTDLQPVFDAVLESATRLCDAHLGVLGLYDGDRYHHVAQRGATPEFQKWVFRGPFRLDPRATGLTRMVRERRPIHIPDLTEELDYKNRVPGRVAIVDIGGARTFLAVPMIKEGRVVGGIVIYRPQVEPFSEKQIALVQTFANQAVIAVENVRLFQEIEEKNQQLETASRHKSQFLASVSHELRTPLNAIIGFTRLVQRKTEGQIPGLQTENLKKVLVSSEHLLHLINSLLDLAKIEAGRMEVIAESFRLDDVVLPAAATVEPMLRDGRVQLVTEIAPELPLLRTDKEKLKQVVLNLLSNAAKFTEEGEIRVSAWGKNGSLKLVVADTGVGMEKEALGSIFEEFRQAEASGPRKHAGTGLGLAIVKRFVTLLGGEIGVESEVGKGSRFTVTLPARFAAPPGKDGSEGDPHGA